MQSNGCGRRADAGRRALRFIIVIAAAAGLVAAAGCGPSRFTLVVVDAAGTMHAASYGDALALDSELSGAVALRRDAVRASAAKAIPCPESDVRVIVRRNNGGFGSTARGCGARLEYDETCTREVKDGTELHACVERLVRRDAASQHAEEGT
ncbi:MAG TPA: hypothetical protein VHB21_01155 [Minicystis sp.]|nr:hypothetical protein [Minicystis sp.]